MSEAPAKSTILIIDDDEQIRLLLTRLLSVENECSAVESADAALKLLAQRTFDVVLSDIDLPGTSGLELVPAILENDHDAVVVMISGQQTIDFAIEAMRVGAFDYITKPVELNHIEAAVRRAVAQRKLLQEKRKYENHLEEMVRERTAQLEHLAYHDRLTGLPNRTAFADRCNQALLEASSKGHVVAVILIGLDRFKILNDTLGHLAADQLLKDVAQRFKNLARSTNLVARFQGAEFAILLSDIRGSLEAELLCNSIRKTLKRSFAVAHQEVYLTASVGISLSTDLGNGTSILQNAGSALHRAKSAGGSNCQFYRADMNASALKRLSLETSLRRAIDSDEFVTFYQPIVKISSAEVVGSEALVRWQHPELGLLAPIEFLDLAESTGLIIEISECVLRTACRQTRLWQETIREDLRVAANISARHFREKDFIHRIVKIVSDSGLDPKSLDLELTESSIMENPEEAAKILRELRSLGIAVAIDDFGTGYSSMSYLKKFCVDTLKIDRSFVECVATDAHDAAMVRAMVTLAHDLNLRVVAEGIETESELAFLRRVRCDEGQGYLFSKPVPAKVLEDKLISSNSPTRTAKQNLLTNASLA